MLRRGDRLAVLVPERLEGDLVRLVCGEAPGRSEAERREEAT